MRSLRIDGGYRAIILKPAQGNVHMLLWADKHDEAYQWAMRHRCSINAETGALQVYQPRQPAEVAVEPVSVEQAGNVRSTEGSRNGSLGRPGGHDRGSSRDS